MCQTVKSGKNKPDDKSIQWQINDFLLFLKDFQHINFQGQNTLSYWLLILSVFEKTFSFL